MTPKQQQALQAIGRLDVYQGWTEDAIYENLKKGYTSGDQEKILAANIHIATLPEFGGWEPDSVGSNILKGFPEFQRITPESVNKTLTQEPTGPSAIPDMGTIPSSMPVEDVVLPPVQPTVRETSQVGMPIPKETIGATRSFDREPVGATRSFDPKLPNIVESVGTGGARMTNAALSYFQHKWDAGSPMTQSIKEAYPDMKDPEFVAKTNEIATTTLRKVQDFISKETDLQASEESQGELGKYILSKEAWTDPKNIIKTPSALASLAASNLPQMLLAAIPGALIITEGGMWSEDAQKDGMDKEYINKWMDVYGVPSGLIETYTDRYIMKGAKATGLDKVIGPVLKKMTSKAMAKVAVPIVQTLTGGAMEGLEELLQGNLSDAVRFMALLDNAKAVYETDPEKAARLTKTAGEIDLNPLSKQKVAEFMLGAIVGTIYKGGGVAASSVVNEKRLFYHKKPRYLHRRKVRQSRRQNYSPRKPPLESH